MGMKLTNSYKLVQAHSFNVLLVTTCKMCDTVTIKPTNLMLLKTQKNFVATEEMLENRYTGEKI
jgi:hypothetical protein